MTIGKSPIVGKHSAGWNRMNDWLAPTSKYAACRGLIEMRRGRGSHSRGPYTAWATVSTCGGRYTTLDPSVAPDCWPPTMATTCTGYPLPSGACTVNAVWFHDTIVAGSTGMVAPSRLKTRLPCVAPKLDPVTVMSIGLPSRWRPLVGTPAGLIAVI